MNQDANEYYLRLHEDELDLLAIEAEERSKQVDEVAERMKRETDEGIILVAFQEYGPDSYQLLRAMFDDYKTERQEVDRSAFAKFIDAHIRREAEIEVDGYE